MTESKELESTHGADHFTDDDFYKWCEEAGVPCYATAPVTPARTPAPVATMMTWDEWVQMGEQLIGAHTPSDEDTDDAMLADLDGLYRGFGEKLEGADYED